MKIKTENTITVNNGIYEKEPIEIDLTDINYIRINGKDCRYYTRDSFNWKKEEETEEYEKKSSYLKDKQKIRIFGKKFKVVFTKMQEQDKEFEGFVYPKKKDML